MTTAFETAISEVYDDKAASEIYVRGSDNQNLLAWFDGDLDGLTVGKPLGEQSKRGAYNSWPVYHYGARVGTLYDDAHGLTFQTAEDDARSIFSEMSEDELKESVVQKFNCAEVEIGEDGSIWIAQPQTGHWLDDPKMAELLDFIQDARK